MILTRLEPRMEIISELCANMEMVYTNELVCITYSNRVYESNICTRMEIEILDKLAMRDKATIHLENTKHTNYGSENSYEGIN